MTTHRHMLLSALLAGWLLAAFAHGQAPVISSIQANGILIWTNAANTDAVYRVEWAAQAGGPWQRFTASHLNSIDAHTNRQFSVAVPMFYRIVMETNPPPLAMVWIEDGDFQMGATNGFANEAPVHPVQLDSFWMDVFEVNMGKWKEVYDWALVNGYDFDNPGTSRDGYSISSPGTIISNLPPYPVMGVNWYDAVKWCNARSEMEGLTANYTYILGPSVLTYKTGQRSNLFWRGTGYRLPTEAEWEYAARGGRQGRRFPWGDTISHQWANYSADPTVAYDVNPTSGHHPWFAAHAQNISQPGAGLPPNGYGLFDMVGNVQEWCWDWHGAYSAGVQTNPAGPATGTNRVRRGGAWNVAPEFSHVSFRSSSPPHDGPPQIGFRCVRKQ